MTDAVNVPFARALLDEIRQRSADARNRVDGHSDPRFLSDVLTDLTRRSRARRTLDPGALRELAALAPDLGRALDRFRTWRFDEESECRAEVAAATIPLAAGLTPLPAAMQQLRRGDAGEWPTGAVLQLERVTSKRAQLDAPPAPSPKPSSSGVIAVGELFVPDAALVEALTKGTWAPEPGPSPAVAAPSPGPVDPELAEWVVGLADAVGGVRPRDGLDLERASCGSSSIDFRFDRLRLGDTIVGRRTLPFGVPGVPLRRTGAINAPCGDAAGSAAHAFGHGSLLTGAALCWTTATPAFAARALNVSATERLDAARAFGLNLARWILDAHFSGLARDAHRDQMQDALGFADPNWRLDLLAAARASAGYPGEEEAAYLGTAALAQALLKGHAVAVRARDRYDEDWFLNPRATDEALLDFGRATEASSLGDALKWLGSETRL